MDLRVRNQDSCVSLAKSRYHWTFCALNSHSFRKYHFCYCLLVVCILLWFWLVWVEVAWLDGWLTGGWLKAGSHYVALCRPGQPQTCRVLLDSASHMLSWQACSENLSAKVLNTYPHTRPCAACYPLPSMVAASTVINFQIRFEKARHIIVHQLFS